MADYLIKLKKLKFTVLSFAPPVTGEDAEGFLFDAAQFRFVYTDASMIWNREGEPACGVGVYFNAANPSNESAPVARTDPMDNNAAKIRAGIVGMNAAKAQGFEKLIIVTNSNFFVEALTTHLHQWLLKWPQTGPISHMKSLFKELIDSMEGLELKLVVIKGRTNVHSNANEQAHWMALQGAYMYQIEHDHQPGSGPSSPGHYDHYQRFIPVFGVIGNSANTFAPPWADTVSPIRIITKREPLRGLTGTPVAGASSGSSAATQTTSIGTRPVSTPAGIPTVGPSTSVANVRKLPSFGDPAATPPIQVLPSSSPVSPTLPASSPPDASSLPSSPKRAKLESTDRI